MSASGALERCGIGRRFYLQAVVLGCCVHFPIGLTALQFASAAPPAGVKALAGPETESRFPPLVLPRGFKATLFACDPLIEYPSVIALGPRAGSVFAARDYLTGLGTKIVRHDEIHLVEDTDGDGYADKSTVFAAGFNSIQGLAFHAGTVYAMHAPLLTALRDTDGDGVADERRDLLSGLGLPPEENDTRLHCANGVVLGHDGWLYLAVGDHGVDVKRPEGDRLILRGGGILRCRPDGRNLHVFAAGLRNIYDVALDEELNVFVRDNENDGGTYLVRVYQSFHGADHGYPYRYDEHPDEAMPPLANLGRGSSAGGVCYLETAFPAELRGSLFFCEWGRSIVRYPRTRSGGTFAPMKEFEFASGAPNDPYGFRPTDVIVDRDGSLLVSDWGDDQRPKRGRGRLYRISSSGPLAPEPPATFERTHTIDAALAHLDSPSCFVRVAAQEALEHFGKEGLETARKARAGGALGSLGRMHAVWVVAHVAGKKGIADLLAVAAHDADPRVQAQAIRAIADLSDPALAAEPNSDATVRSDLARRLSDLAIGADPRVVLEVVVALGRLHDRQAPAWLRDHLQRPDGVLRHAAQQALRQADNWPGVLALLDDPVDRPVRRCALGALAERADPLVVDGLIDRLRREDSAKRRLELTEALARVYKKPGPWTYWGYRPSPRPANTVAWERTASIERALQGALADPDRDLRAEFLRRMQREQVPAPVAALRRWLQEERESHRVKVILASLAGSRGDDARRLLEDVIRSPGQAPECRQEALSMWIGWLDAASESRLLDLGDHLESGRALVEIIRQLGNRPKVDSRRFLLSRLDSSDAEVRASALAALAELHVGEARIRVPRLLDDRDGRVRRAAAAAAGTLAVKDSAPALDRLLRDPDPTVRGASLDALRRLHVSTKVAAAVAALAHPRTRLAAIDYLVEYGTFNEAAALSKIAQSDRSIDVLHGVVRALAAIEAREECDRQKGTDLARTLAEVQGHCGVVVQWHVFGPLAPADAASLADKLQERGGDLPGGTALMGEGPDSVVPVALEPLSKPGFVRLAVSEIRLAEAGRVQFLAGSNEPFEIDVNGHVLLQRLARRPFQPNADLFAAELPRGASRVTVRLNADRPARFHVCFRPASSLAEHERLAQVALKSAGSRARGREVFLNAEKSLCMKCHRIGESGNRIGPDLTGIGARFSRVHLIESILEPSRTIAPSYECQSAVLTSGRVLVGVVVTEDATTLTFGDEKGIRQTIRKAEIEERTTLRRSLMPDGLEKRLTEQEFVDLLAYLVSQSRPSDDARPSVR